ncbi:EDD domain protein, DegV family [Halanaerobium congolense]|jgi:DegV family protein with EDD domain|uniref:EDD domain protein, DegV family n=1 Tax=Halanaerobium congolense TaxID=54121 RepID=A0A1M7PBY7_9FIRM|nr:DegV family protein [Halanaerobium congolense]SDF98996.1 EDD domain protein, DegV family [Halanaerobium congolense]SET17351.1 EDD domain protein, DegV family [Halanaerobium congolense]SFP65297.1 EDD domain protein, DegV family [Halanaerobium congolense]SHN14306.1 EDD domain protein, DegV family [Halanaerobium congolense]
MNFKIIVDSCCDLTEELRERFNISTAPLSIDVGNKHYIDDENLDRDGLLDAMRNSSDVPKTASPGPGPFLDLYQKYENSFVVTLSKELSASYQNAVLAKELLKEEAADKFVKVFNSFSASAGETMIAYKLGELIEAGLNRDEIVEKTEKYVEEMQTLFVLDSLDNLIKAGRMGKLKGKIASFFNIKPVLGATPEGTITLFDKARGSKRAIRKLVEKIGERGENLEKKVLGIAHCNALEKAEYIKEKAAEKYNFRETIIVETAGISTVYANEGGIVLAF